MSRYVVRFMKDVLGQYGRQSEVCQGTLELHHWSLHADRIHVQAADFPS